jgi:hypothetical protein
MQLPINALYVNYLLSLNDYNYLKQLNGAGIA